MLSLPQVDFFGHSISRLICGGNPFSGFSHLTPELDRDMREYYTGANMQKCFDSCSENGVNTIQCRGDKHIMRQYLEHKLAGGDLNWIAQIASEFASHANNVSAVAGYGAMAIYYHGTYIDNLWHDGRIDEARDVLKAIRDAGLPAGVGTHQPEVIEYCEEHDWETDFYMGCFYNLSRKHKAVVALGEREDAEHYLEEDPPRMAATLRAVDKPCLAFKIMAAGRRCSTPDDVKAAFKFAFDNIKPTDAVVVGHFQKHRDQVAENARMVREILD